MPTRADYEKIGTLGGAGEHRRWLPFDEESRDLGAGRADGSNGRVEDCA